MVYFILLESLSVFLESTKRQVLRCSTFLQAPQYHSLPFIQIVTFAIVLTSLRNKAVSGCSHFFLNVLKKPLMNRIKFYLPRERVYHHRGFPLHARHRFLYSIFVFVSYWSHQLFCLSLLDDLTSLSEKFFYRRVYVPSEPSRIYFVSMFIPSISLCKSFYNSYNPRCYSCSW